MKNAIENVKLKKEIRVRVRFVVKIWGIDWKDDKWLDSEFFTFNKLLKRITSDFYDGRFAFHGNDEIDKWRTGYGVRRPIRRY